LTKRSLLLAVIGALAVPTLSCGGKSEDTATGDVDTAGTWYAKLSAPGSLQPAITDSVTISAWIRQYVAPTGDITFNICKLTVTGGSVFSTTYTQALIDTLQVKAELAGDTRVPIGSTIDLPSFTIYSGQTSDGDAVDALPPPFPAGDGDGKPGVTIPTHVTLGTLAGDIDIYAGLVVTTNMSDVKLTDATTIAGNTSINTHGIVFGSTNSLIVTAGSTLDVTTTDPTIPFSAKKLDSDGSHDCAYIAAQ
jgi:hypothetical protein